LVGNHSTQRTPLSSSWYQICVQFRILETMTRILVTTLLLGCFSLLAQQDTSYFTLEDSSFEKGQCYRLDKNVIWEYEGEILITSALEELEAVVDFMKSNPKLMFEIQVYADCRRTDMEYKLEEIRAEALQAYFVYMGVDDSRLFPKGFPYPDYVRPISVQDSLLCPWLEVGTLFDCEMINKKKSDKKVSAQYRIFSRCELKIISTDGFLKGED
jgi:hypothetical protein